MSANFRLLRFPQKKTFESQFALTFPFVLFVLRRLRVRESEIEDLAERLYLAYFRESSEVAPGRVSAWLATTARHFAFGDFHTRGRIPGKSLTRA